MAALGCEVRRTPMVIDKDRFERIGASDLAVASAEDPVGMLPTFPYPLPTSTLIRKQVKVSEG